MNDYVGTAVTALAIERPQYWVRDMVNLGLVRDNRARKKPGLRLAFGLYEFYQLTAVASAFKYQRFVHLKHMPLWQEFNRALEDFIFDPACTNTTYDIISTREGYRAGWDFERLEDAASANYAMALRMERRGGLTIASYHKLHAQV